MYNYTYYVFSLITPIKAGYQTSAFQLNIPEFLKSTSSDSENIVSLWRACIRYDSSHYGLDDVSVAILLPPLCPFLREIKAIEQG